MPRSRALSLPVGLALAIAAASGGSYALSACHSDAADVAATLDAGAAVTCPVAAPTEDPVYHPPRATQDTCSLGIGAYVTRFFDQAPTTTYTELEEAIKADPTLGGAPCAACVFSKEEDPEWGPIVYASGGSGAASLDWGACYARASGGTEACGQAVQQSRTCVDAVCSSEDCVTASAARTCSQRALGEPTGCGRFPVSSACGALLQPLSRSCKSIEELVNVMCATEGAITDAGADASDDGGGGDAG